MRGLHGRRIRAYGGLQKGVTEEEVRNSVIAVPGLKTSAYLGLRLAWGDCDIAVVPFDEIIPRILDGTYLSGLIIHEGQLTYVDHDLDVLIDLGKWWNARTANWPMPLGGNVVRRDLGEAVMQDITKYTKMSIEYALKSPDEALEFAKAWGRESTMRPTKNLWVCTLTTEPSTTGKKLSRFHPLVHQRRTRTRHDSFRF